MRGRATRRGDATYVVSESATPPPGTQTHLVVAEGRQRVRGELSREGHAPTRRRERQLERHVAPGQRPAAGAARREGGAAARKISSCHWRAPFSVPPSRCRAARAQGCRDAGARCPRGVRWIPFRGDARALRSGRAAHGAARGTHCGASEQQLIHSIRFLKTQQRPCRSACAPPPGFASPLPLHTREGHATHSISLLRRRKDQRVRHPSQQRRAWRRPHTLLW